MPLRRPIEQLKLQPMYSGAAMVIPAKTGNFIGNCKSDASFDSLDYTSSTKEHSSRCDEAQILPAAPVVAGNAALPDLLAAANKRAAAFCAGFAANMMLLFLAIEIKIQRMKWMDHQELSFPELSY